MLTVEFSPYYKFPTLPDTPSELLLIALKDLESVENNESYIVDMGTWHSPTLRDNNVCHVCLGGAVIAGTLKIDPSFLLYVDSFENHPDIVKKLLALDSFKEGHVDAGLNYLKVDRPNPIKYKYFMRSYQIDPIDWKEGMRKIVTDLQQVGL